MIKYYVEAYIDYGYKRIDRGTAKINNSIAGTDIKKAYVKCAGALASEIILKYPDWFNAPSEYRGLSTIIKRGLVKLPKCDSPEEYKETFERLKEPQCEE